MAKVSGIGALIKVDDSTGAARDVSSDVGSYTLNVGNNVVDVSAISASAMERLSLRSDVSINLTGAALDFGSNLAHDVFKVMTGERTVELGPIGSGTGDPKISFEGVIESYTPTADASGASGWSATIMLSNGTAPSWTTY
tara:strand:+ start:2522 stop:2941 length:420 start_codon:yes stop_codon:yes gene_type:complete